MAMDTPSSGTNHFDRLPHDPPTLKRSMIQQCCHRRQCVRQQCCSRMDEKARAFAVSTFWSENTIWYEPRQHCPGRNRFSPILVDCRTPLASLPHCQAKRLRLRPDLLHLELEASGRVNPIRDLTQMYTTVTHSTQVSDIHPPLEL